LALRNNFLKAGGQSRRNVFALVKCLAEAMDDCAFKCGGQVSRRLRRFRIVPDGALFRARRSQHAIKIVLPRATLKIYELGNREATQNSASLWRDWLQQRECFFE
jgi:hypothetical protein